MHKRKLVMVDTSGSTHPDNLQTMFDFAQANDADLLAFDTQVYLPPSSATEMNIEDIRGGGGTDVGSALSKLGAFMREQNVKYDEIYILGDLQMMPFRKTDIVDYNINFTFLAVLGTGENEYKLVDAFRADLEKAGVANRANVLSFQQFIKGK